MFKKGYCKNCGQKLSRKKYTYCQKCYVKTMKGQNHPNYKHGGTLKKHHCIKCGKEINYYTFMYGQKTCHSCCKLNKCGKQSNNWKGGITELHFWIRSLNEMDNWRNKVFQRDNFTCQKCGNKLGLEAHHKKQFAILLNEFLKEYDQFSPIEDKETLVRLAMKWKPFWDIDNGKTLCDDCHTHSRKRKIKKALK